MTIHSLQRPLLFVSRLPGFGRVFPTDPVAGDLPATGDPRETLPWASALLLAATIPVVALTGAAQVGTGFAFRDVVALMIGYSLIMLTLVRVPWTRLPPDLSWALVGVQLLFVVSLTTMTGGGESAYFALYAPTLAIAGWYLRSSAFILVVASIALLEAWRALAVDRDGSFSQVTIGLPFFAAVGFLALLTARRLSTALVTIRQDQRRTADTLAAVHELASDLAADPLLQVAGAAERVFGGNATAIAIEPAVEAGDRSSGQRSAGNQTIAIAGAVSTYGLLIVDRKTPLSSTERRLAAILADTAGRAIDAHRLFQEVRGASERDALTGLRNRRSLEADMKHWIMPALATGRSVTVAFLDIDGLKETNDVHGHEVGDQLIRRAGRGLAAAVREDDRVYRVGGDEFVVVALGLSVSESRRLRDRLARTTAANRRQHDEAPSRLRLSVGLARGSGDDVDPAELLAEADRAMYRAKAASAGRGPQSGS